MKRLLQHIRSGNRIVTGNRGEKGAAYLMALIALTVGLVFALATLRSTAAFYTSEDTRTKKQAAVALAEAGIDYAYWRIHYKNQKLPYTKTANLSTGSFRVTVTDDGNNQMSTMLITSTGTSGNYKHTEKRVELGPLPYYYTLCENDKLDCSKMIRCTESGIRSNGEVKVENDTNYITCGVWSGSTITTKGTVTPTYTYTPPIAFPEVDTSYYRSVASVVHSYYDVYYWDLWSYADHTVIYSDKKILLAGTYHGNFTIVSTDDIVIKSSLMPATSSSHIALISTKKVNIESSATYVQAIIYCHKHDHNAQVDIHSAARIVGSVAADKVNPSDDLYLDRDNDIDIELLRKLKMPGL